MTSLPHLPGSAPKPAAQTGELHPVDIAGYLAQDSEPLRECRRIFGSAGPAVICDIGACEGEDSVRYARAFPQARILAFEPLPANQAMVRANFARYQTDRGLLIPVALSDRLGEATFHVSSGRPRELFAGEHWNYGNKSSSLLPPAASDPMHGWIEFKEAITVPTSTLDAVCAEQGVEHIDFIHMDVQGAELLVLAGAPHMLPRTSAVWLEVSTQELYSGQPLDRDVRQFMAQQGFQLCYSTRHGDGLQGDHLYVNLHHPRMWAYAATRRLRLAIGRTLLRARRYAARS